MDVDEIAQLLIVKNAKNLKVDNLNLLLLRIDICILDFVGVRELAYVDLLLLDYVDETKGVDELSRAHVAT